MRFNNKFNVTNEFEDIFSFENEDEELEHDAQMLTFKFLEVLRNSQPRNSKFKKKDLAKALGKSPSFISQVYSGDKLLNFILLAKIQKSFDINFEINAHFNNSSYIENTPSFNLQELKNSNDGFWVWINKKPDYSKCDDCNNNINSPNDKMSAA